MYAMEYYLIIKRNRLLIHTLTTRMTLQRILVYEKKSIPEHYILYDSIYIISLEIIQIIETNGNGEISECQRGMGWAQKRSGCSYKKITEETLVVIEMF